MGVQQDEGSRPPGLQKCRMRTILQQPERCHERLRLRSFSALCIKSPRCGLMLQVSITHQVAECIELAILTKSAACMHAPPSCILPVHFLPPFLLPLPSLILP